LKLIINEESIELMPEDVVPIYARIDFSVINLYDGIPSYRLWYHRIANPEQIAAGADAHGVWENMALSAPFQG
jgi:hypothetical protein